MSDEVTEYFALLIFKNQLLCCSNDELVKMYEDDKMFWEFLDTIALMSQKEPAFFLLSDEINDSIHAVIDSHRYSCDKEMSEYINKVIVYLNNFANVDKNLADVMRISYLNFNEEYRGVEFKDNKSFLASLAYDAVVFAALYNDNLDNVDNGDLAVCSLNYLINMLPEFFNDDSIKVRALYILDKEFNNSRRFSDRKKSIRLIRNNLINISKNTE